MPIAAREHVGERVRCVGREDDQRPGEGPALIAKVEVERPDCAGPVQRSSALLAGKGRVHDRGRLGGRTTSARGPNTSSNARVPVTLQQLRCMAQQRVIWKRGAVRHEDRLSAPPYRPRRALPRCVASTCRRSSTAASPSQPTNSTPSLARPVPTTPRTGSESMSSSSQGRSARPRTLGSPLRRAIPHSRTDARVRRVAAAVGSLPPAASNGVPDAHPRAQSSGWSPDAKRRF